MSALFIHSKQVISVIISVHVHILHNLSVSSLFTLYTPIRIRALNEFVSKHGSCPCGLVVQTSLDSSRGSLLWAVFLALSVCLCCQTGMSKNLAPAPKLYPSQNLLFNTAVVSLPQTNICIYTNDWAWSQRHGHAQACVGLWCGMCEAVWCQLCVGLHYSTDVPGMLSGT